MDLKPSFDALPSRGPKFFREGDDIMFAFVIDSTNIVGPRPATGADKHTHIEAWEAFEEGAPEPEEAAESPAVSFVEEQDMDAFKARLEAAGETPVRDGAAKIEQGVRRRRRKAEESGE